MIKPSEGELEILQILWDNGPSSVRFVHDKLSEKKDSRYTTTLKIMQIMTEKGLTSRNTSSRTHIYSAFAREEETKSGLLKKFVSSTFKGSLSSLVISALGDAEPSNDELDQIKSLISEIEKRS